MDCDTNRLKPNAAELKELIQKRWPQTLAAVANEELVFGTGLSELDALFSLGGIPYGQLIEITGGVSSGKTSFLFKLLARLTRKETVAYIDFSNTFFPSAAVAGGIDITRLLLVKPNSHSADDSIKSGLRTAELLLRERTVRCVVFDLVGQKKILPIVLLHRLRLKTVRAKALVILLSENNSEIIPSSMASLRLEVRRRDNNRLKINITKSRISKEGVCVEVLL